MCVINFSRMLVSCTVVVLTLFLVNDPYIVHPYVYYY